jgi:glycine/D-amino acid oxidase-like deaminating enzyme
MDLHDGTPFWPRRDGLLGLHPPLERDERCDVLVVGAGITGSLIALELTRRGIDTVLIDRRDAGGGSTSASTSMLQYEIDELLIDLEAAYGWELASTAYLECSRGIDLVERATQTVGVNCGFRRSPSVFIATKKRDVATLQREMKAREKAGFEVAWLSKEQLRERWGLVGVAGIESANGASVDPYPLCHHALATATRRGARVYDRTEAVVYEFTSRSATITTNRGTSIRAGHVIMATGYETKLLLPELPFVLHSSFALVTEPIVGLDRQFPDGLLFWDYDDPYIYGRTTDDERILIGGKDEDYRDALRRRRAMPSKTRSLMNDLPKRFPGLPATEVAFSWCGTFSETPDGLAYIGGHSKFPRCFFALGFGGNGITYSAVAAQYLVDRIERKKVDYAQQIFDLERPIVRPS